MDKKSKLDSAAERLLDILEKHSKDVPASKREAKWRALDKLVAKIVMHATRGRIRAGLIGLGDRGSELLPQVPACPTTEVVAFSDVCIQRLEKAKGTVPAAATYLDYRRSLDDPSTDSVVIAVPRRVEGIARNTLGRGRTVGWDSIKEEIV